MALSTSYSHGVPDAALLADTIGANLAATTSRHPACDALVEVATGRRWTYRELHAWARSVAKGLMAKGIGPGDRVGIWSPNCAEWLALQYGTALVGAILVNLNPAYRTSELGFALRQSGVRLLVSATRVRTTDHRAIVDQVRAAGDCPELSEVIWIGEGSWADLEAAGAAVGDEGLDGVTASLSCDDPINIQYTSGTTGSPKGATLSHHNILNNGYSIGELLGYGEGDRICVPVPFYHCFGMVIGNLAATSHGSTIVVPAPLFDAGDTLAAVAGERCTSLYGVPTMFIAMLAHPSFATTDLSSLRTGVMAGSPCPVEVMKRVITDMHMPEVAICYGMTETSPVSTQTRVDDDLDRRTSTVGRVMPHLEVKVVDPTSGRTVAPGTAGELCTRGYSVMLGYWDEPERTAEAIDAARWMHTGDLAVMRPDGYVNIVGRIKDLVIRGGENIYPREVEEHLYGHPDIEDVQVIGVPDERYGEELMAWVKLRAGAAALDAEGLRAFCDGRIARHKVPRYVHVVEEFPMTVTGKVRKVEMRQVSIGLLGLEAVAGVATA